MLQNDVIEPLTSPWTPSTVLVRKKDWSVRFSVDYLWLNCITNKDSYLLSKIGGPLDTIRTSKVLYFVFGVVAGKWRYILNAREKIVFTTGMRALAQNYAIWIK